MIPERVRFRFAASVLVLSALLLPIPLSAEQVPVRHIEGLLHGFLALLTLDGKRLADGDMTQIVKDDRVSSHLTFRFRDGSICERRPSSLSREYFGFCKIIWWSADHREGVHSFSCLTLMD
jgi:hypothetical protein